MLRITDTEKLRGDRAVPLEIRLSEALTRSLAILAVPASVVRPPLWPLSI
jgi:hypothetical protein